LISDHPVKAVGARGGLAVCPMSTLLPTLWTSRPESNPTSYYTSMVI